jgi:hypothetical protein
MVLQHPCCGWRLRAFLQLPIVQAGAAAHSISALQQDLQMLLLVLKSPRCCVHAGLLLPLHLQWKTPAWCRY